ncbi:TIGR03620 family F420-dependent LLM class oxidoreductase [Nocardia sp. alder85J]|uniref:TIGR03620 family F420-dependent LLM class oxidoreductase n=1 Tax=Nocardia sp. alder85J TaxID=2862949 RepID=UPI001CD35C50|nr:TIGR03620 family F420-dependent LLM class oxidoreductase [Nocardia sp. alder85J]MCX4090953.1 TIGR03620 family F420-dependent LLM class oxidoreductase [Nocardia sp. alder85J]
MGSTDGPDLRARTGKFGVWTFDFEHLPAARMRDAIQELEGLGWPAFWIPELYGRDAFTHAGFLLSCTERIQIVNGIAGIWSRGAEWTHGAALLLADAYPGRHVLGLGYGGKPRPGVTPLAAVTAYLDELDALDTPNPKPQLPIRRILAAYGPKMLELARDRAAGAHTYKVTVAHTARARDILGPDAFLGVEQAVLFETDPDRARAIARDHLAVYLNGVYNVAKFRRLGYTEDEISGGGSDRLVDDLVFWGDPDTVVEKLHTQLAAGADHVGVQVIGVERGGSALPQWRRLAEALVPAAAAQRMVLPGAIEAQVEGAGSPASR